MLEMRENIQRLFDYCGDIRRNGNNLRAAQYSQGFSPNNIKTVVVSVEGIMIRLHKPYSGSLPKGVNRLSNKTLYIGVLPYKLYAPDKDGKVDVGISIFKMLVRPIVYACIEEIIILNGVANTAYTQFVKLQQSYDLNKDDLLVGYSKSGDQHKDIAERFSRLHNITTVSLNFMSFINTYKQHRDVFEKLDFLNESMENYIVNEEIYNKEYWLGIKVQPSTYQLDNSLKSYFEAIKEKHVASTKEEKLEEFKENLHKKEAEELSYAIERYVSLCSVPLKLRAIVASGDANRVVDGLTYPLLQYEKLIEYQGMPKVRDSFIDKDTQLSFKEAIQHNKTVVGSTAKLVTLTSKAFIDTLFTLHESSPIAFKVVIKKIKEQVNDNKVAILVPNECRGRLEAMQTGLDFSCDSKNMVKSIVNAVWLFSICFVDNNANTSKYKELSTWTSMVAKKGDKN